MFSDSEKRTLAQFMTNIDKPIFVLKNLPEVVKGALFSRYSRTSKSLREVLLQDFIQASESGFKDIVNYGNDDTKSDVVAIKKAEEFYDRVLVGYGDDSVAELAGVHIAIEDISNIAVKFIQDARLGISPLEKSTRYVYFDKKDEKGNWLYIKEQRIMESNFADDYIKTCDFLFETYSKLKDEVSSFVEEKYPQGEESERAYKSTVRAKTCDLLRGLLPASTKTNMGAYGNGRAFEYLLAKMYSSDLVEIRVAAELMHDELSKVIPSFVKRANNAHGKELQQYWKEIRNNMKHNNRIQAQVKDNFKLVNLIHYEEDYLDKLVCFVLFEHSNVSLDAISKTVREMPVQKKNNLLLDYIGNRKNRRQKPGRAFENLYYTFDVCANFGCYRDIQRHRILTQQRQFLTTENWYDLPNELVEGGFDEKFKDAMQMADQTYKKIAKKMPEEAQYVVPFAYKLRWYMTMNLREAYHFCELRSTQQGHIDYRRVAQQIYQQIKQVHPFVEMNVDMNEYGLERLEAEKKLDKKLEDINKKYH